MYAWTATWNDVIVYQAEDGIRDYKVTGVQTCALLFQAEDGIRDYKVTGVQTCALPISCRAHHSNLRIHCSCDTLRASDLTAVQFPLLNLSKGMASSK